MEATINKNSVSRKLKWMAFLLVILFTVLLTSACKKDNPGTGKANLSVRLTDAPASYDVVLIDIVGVEVIGEDGRTVFLHTNSGIYNLFDFSNGLNTLIASGDLDAGRIMPIHLNTTITASSPTLTASTVANEQGKFVIKGLPAGMYDVTVTPDLPLLPITNEGVTVKVGVTTDLGSIPL